MPYTVNYRIAFKTTTLGDVPGDTAEDIFCDIADRDSPEGTAVYTDLEPASDPVIIETVNNGRDPFQPIIAKSARIQFLSTALLNSDTFAQGTDGRFFVHIYTATTTLFLGFLLMDDIEESFRNPTFKNVVTLTATDNIGTLKEQPFRVELGGDAISDGHYLGIAYLIMPLAQTGLSLNLNIVWNVFEEDMDPDDSPINQLYLWTLSFEKEVGTKEDAYTVLQKMASSLKARIFQYKGEWWFVRLHEYRTSLTTLKRIKYGPDGVAITAIEEIEISEVIESSGSLYFIGQHSKVPVRADKFDKDTFRFEYPKEIPANKSFTRGDLISGTNPKLFEIADWTLEKYGGGDPDVTAYIRRAYDSNDQEESRYVVITGGANEHWIRSNAVPLHEKDKFNFSVSQRFSQNLTGSSGYYTHHVAMLRLHGDDGTYWNLYSGVGSNSGIVEWRQSNSAFSANIGYLSYYYDITQQDETVDWWTVEIEAPPLPVSGDLFVLLRKADIVSNAYDTYFSDLQFEYIPFINGNYARYNGQAHTVTQADDYKANHDDEVAVSDTVKKLFKGAIKKYNGTKHVLTENWTDDFSGEGPMRLGKILVYDTWNQYKDSRATVRGTVRGRISGYSFLLNKFTLADYSASKRFIFLSEEVNLKTLETTGELVEVFDTTKPSDYTTTHAFNYE